MPEMPNLDEIMKMAQEVQAEMQKAQENLDKIEVEGVSGGGLVKVRASAKGRIHSVSIDDSLLQRLQSRSIGSTTIEDGLVVVHLDQ